MAHRSTFSREPLRPLLAWVSALALWSLALPLATAEKDAPPVDVERLRRNNAEMQRQLDAASGPEFYLVLDPAQDRLRLMLAGVVLQDYAIQAAELAVPRVMWRQRPVPADWQLLTWTQGQIDPAPERERIELVASADGSAPPPSVPHIAVGPQQPPASGVYWIRYDGNLALEIRYTYVPPDSQEVRGPSPLQRARDALIGAWTMFRNPTAGDALRVRVHLAWEDACALYAALPPKSKLLFLTEAISASG